jgi:ubiquinone biosynthesis accessory factor UbiJ
MISTTQLSVIEAGLNRMLKADPDTVARLRPLNGRTLRIDSWLADDFSVFVTFDEEGVRLADHFDNDVDASIKGSPLGFMRAALNPDDRRVFNDGTLAIFGEATLVQSFADLFRHYQYDWQQRVEPVIGDAATARIEVLLEQMATARHAVREKIVTDAGDYLREEQRLLASHDSVAAFADAVDELMADVERMQKRIERLGKTVR